MVVEGALPLRGYVLEANRTPSGTPSASAIFLAVATVGSCAPRSRLAMVRGVMPARLASSRLERPAASLNSCTRISTPPQ